MSEKNKEMNDIEFSLEDIVDVSKDTSTDSGNRAIESDEIIAEYSNDIERVYEDVSSNEPEAEQTSEPASEAAEEQAEEPGEEPATEEHTEKPVEEQAVEATHSEAKPETNAAENKQQAAATEKKKREIHQLGIGDSLLGGRTVVEKDQQTIEYETWKSIEHDRRARTILRSTIDSIRLEPNSLTVQIVTHYKGLPVIINDSDFFMNESRFTEDYYRTSLFNNEEHYLNERFKEVVDAYIKTNREAYDAYVSKNGSDDGFITEGWSVSAKNKIRAKIIDERKAKIRHRTAKFMIGAKICFFIKSCKRERLDHDLAEERGYATDFYYTIYGDRVSAMNMIQYLLFVRRKNPVAVGDAAMANVLRVTSTAVHVECCGVETRISANDLSSKKVISDPSDYFKPGDSFMVIIRKVFLPTDHSAKSGFALSVSRRLYERGIADKNLLYMHEGDIHMGEVSFVSRERRGYTILLNNGVTCYVPAKLVASRLPLYIQDKVLVEIIKIDYDKSSVLGKADKIM